MIKLAYSSKNLTYRGPRAEETRAIRSLAKVARHAALSRIAVDPASHFYLDSWAVSAYEKFGLNENGDGFERDQLRKGYRTFIGSWVCLDHENWEQTLAVGSNVDAVYMPDDYVRVAMAVDRERSEARRPGIEAKIAAGEITDTSMGVFASESCCSLPKCANVAADETEFCDHVRPPQHGGLRGMVLCNALTNWERIRCGELNRGLLFFENTIITSDEGADRNAKIIAKLAARAAGNPQAAAICRAIRDAASDSGPQGKAVLARLVHLLLETLH